jgi:hypothetical protein
LLLVVLETGALTMTAVAEPPASPADSIKVRTTTIHSQPGAAHDNALLPSANSFKAPALQFHTLHVRPRLPDEQRDPSGRPLSATREIGNVKSDADLHVVHTVPIRQEPVAPDHRVVRTIRVPSQSAPQEELR